VSRLVTLLFSALLPVCLFAATPEKQDKPATIEKVGGIPIEDIQIYGIWALDRTATVLLTDRTGKNIIRLGFEPDENGSRLISASIQADGKTMKIVAMLDGKEHSFSRPIASMPVPDKDLMLASLRQAVTSAEKEGTSQASEVKPRRGPSEEDRKKYESLSDAAKEKFRNGMREMFSDEKFRNAPEEERRSAIRTLFDKIEKEDSKP
jgi:hypothetical protein